ncbi:hypothetical protein F0562_005964 [Nyssa sinensis]|uniref:Uncharacterized protein n=1 Tax=Nyssa sinensis TaxID=561372 RepID=A0A5J5AJM1_9ASTE|nr:hypothetical protein F0562_005964 [Nyssa sinensis]
MTVAYFGEKTYKVSVDLHKGSACIQIVEREVGVVRRVWITNGEFEWLYAAMVEASKGVFNGETEIPVYSGAGKGKSAMMGGHNGEWQWVLLDMHGSWFLFELREELSAVAAGENQPWCIAGDFTMGSQSHYVTLVMLRGSRYLIA